MKTTQVLVPSGCSWILIPKISPKGAAVFVALVAAASCAMSQVPPASTNPTSSPSAAIKPKAPVVNANLAKLASKSGWKELTPAQQNSLQPLQSGWDGLTDGQKRKWIAISQNYPSRSVVEQNKLHSRMREWAALSQLERTQARLNFAETAKLSPTEKAATWQAYQALSAEEKQKLAAKARTKPMGAAIAVKPAGSQKLAAVPLMRHGVKPGNPVSKMAASNHAIGQPGLPPQGQLAPEPANMQKN